MITLYGVAEVARAWGVSQQRVRELIAYHRVVPDYCYQTDKRVMYFWKEIPERSAR